MYCLRSELVADQSLDLPPTIENIIFLMVGMVLLHSLVLALCIFEKVSFGWSLTIASSVCACGLTVYFITRAKSIA